jgi:hypothetical protein
VFRGVDFLGSHWDGHRGRVEGAEAVGDLLDGDADFGVGLGVGRELLCLWGVEVFWSRASRGVVVVASQGADYVGAVLGWKSTSRGALTLLLRNVFVKVVNGGGEGVEDFVGAGFLGSLGFGLEESIEGVHRGFGREAGSRVDSDGAVNGVKGCGVDI